MSAIGTFSAPFATIVPEGVIAYYIKDCDGAAKTLTESDNAYILTRVIGATAFYKGKIGSAVILRTSSFIPHYSNDCSQQ